MFKLSLLAPTMHRHFINEGACAQPTMKASVTEVATNERVSPTKATVLDAESNAPQGHGSVSPVKASPGFEDLSLYQESFWKGGRIVAGACSL
jgi:hypothetical protein